MTDYATIAATMLDAAHPGFSMTQSTRSGVIVTLAQSADGRFMLTLSGPRPPTYGDCMQAGAAFAVPGSAMWKIHSHGDGVTARVEWQVKGQET